MDYSIRSRDVDRRRLDDTEAASIRPGRSDDIVRAKRAAQAWQNNNPERTTVPKSMQGDRNPHPLIVRNQLTRKDGSVDP